MLVGEFWKLAVRAYSWLKLLEKTFGVAGQHFVMLCHAQLVQEHQARAQEGLPQPLPEDHDKEVREVAHIHHPVQSLRNCESTTSTRAEFRMLHCAYQATLLGIGLERVMMIKTP